MSRQHDLHVLPVGIFCNLLADKVFQLSGEFGHEFRAGCDAIAVKGTLLGHLEAFSQCLIPRHLCIKCGPKSPRSLLVHFGSGCDAVDGHEEELLWLDLAKEMFYVVEDGDEHCVFSHAERWRVRILVSAIVNNAIHIQLSGLSFMKVSKSLDYTYV